MNRSKENAGAIFCPQGDLTIYTAQQQKEQLMLAINRNTIQINLSEVTDMDTAGLQLLILAKLESLRRNIPLIITGHTRAVLDVIELCNLSGFFGDPVFIPSDNADKGAIS
ncbi:STAS domain-containing protein [Rheinheimera hassiensis]|uniref:STAS domain-containing protein n=1 Tax=Rheinheimera hassiensis TaxID=1193627 RepID=UPI001F066AF7|nr:STAS domain-containing protein [Rheinheimera hassiensis]